jgi:hypothetical protein
VDGRVGGWGTWRALILKACGILQLLRFDHPLPAAPASALPPAAGAGGAGAPAP